MPKSRYRLPCPHCGGSNNRALGFAGLIETESVAVLLRRYRCRDCGKGWQSIELADVPMGTPPLEWLGLEPEPSEYHHVYTWW